MIKQSRRRVTGLLSIVFVTGAAVLIVEVAAIRILSIYFGNTIYTDSGVIGVILAALAAGYWRGGVLADRDPAWRGFFRIVQRGGLALVVLFFLMGALPSLTLLVPLTWGPLAAALVLFFAPSYFLGMLSPFAIRLGQDEERGIGTGTISGKVFFWSTCGSIAGTLAASFVLIPSFGLNAIILGTTLVVLLVGTVGQIAARGRKRRWAEIFFLALCFAALSGAYYVNAKTPPDAVYQKDGLYQRQTVLDGTYEGRPARALMQDRTADGAVYLDGHDLAAPYTDYYALYKIFDPNLTRALFIGGGAYSMPTALHRDLPDAQIDVAEIEPSLFPLAQKYFGVPDDPHLVNHIEDGRRFLAAATTTYGMIFSDVYYSLYSTPPAFTTEEFFALARQKLAPGGIFIANLIGTLAPSQPSFIFSELRTIREVFPETYVFAVSSTDSSAIQNIIVLGVNGGAANVGATSTLALSAVPPSFASPPPPLPVNLAAHLLPLQNDDLAAYPILTDNYAPVEYMIAKTLDGGW